VESVEMTSHVELRAAIARELAENLLPFWRDRSVDAEHGGFIGEMSNGGIVDKDAPKGLILNARILWSFAAAYRGLGDERDLALAQRAFRFLIDRFSDREHGGFLWRLDAFGRPLDVSKKIYGQAFSIYALSEYHLATGAPEALAAARATFDLVERHAHDADRGGYVETLARDWSAATEQRLSDKDLDAPKSMNNHLHILEAYTNLYRVWPEATVAERLGELIDLFDRHIVGRTKAGSHLRHFFDEQWHPVSQEYTFGHDIEAAWLLVEAAEVLRDKDRSRRMSAVAEAIARSVLEQALDKDGGLVYEGRGGTIVDANREWWCQAEAVVGFWQAYEATGREVFAEAAHEVWSFVEQRVVDRQGGEWFWRIFPDGSVDDSEPKVSEWKSPYHNMRMCLEMLRRLDQSL
jgi:mannobiose 2-epimerase